MEEVASWVKRLKGQVNVQTKDDWKYHMKILDVSSEATQWGDYLGTEGLKLGDFPELVVKGGKVDFSEVPTIVNVRKSLSKSGKPYTTFL